MFSMSFSKILTFLTICIKRINFLDVRKILGKIPSAIGRERGERESERDILKGRRERMERNRENLT